MIDTFTSARHTGHERGCCPALNLAGMHDSGILIGLRRLHQMTILGVLLERGNGNMISTLGEYGQMETPDSISYYTLSSQKPLFVRE